MSPRDVERICDAIRSAGGSIAFAVFMGLMYMSCMQGLFSTTHLK